MLANRLCSRPSRHCFVVVLACDRPTRACRSGAISGASTSTYSARSASDGCSGGGLALLATSRREVVEERVRHGLLGSASVGWVELQHGL